MRLGITLFIPVLLVLGGCGATKAATTMNTTYLNELATKADGLVTLAHTDPGKARAGARALMENMCAYVAGLENAGLSHEQVQKHIDSVGDRLGAAFALAGE